MTKEKHILTYTYFLTTIICVCLVFPMVSQALIDKSGVKPQVLSLPSGPGSIEGLGESFEPQLNSGTASYQVPLAVPPGRAGFTPTLTLIYNGGNGNGPFGIGWGLAGWHIQRRTDKGLPVYDDAKDTFTGPSGEELVPVSGGNYRSENETSFDLYAREDIAWKVRHKNGSTSWYGLDDKSRIQNTEAGRNNIFRWHLSKSQDANNNTVIYKYNEAHAFSGNKAPEDGQVYLTSIIYNQNSDSDTAMQVDLKYEVRPEHDRVFNYRSRFPVQTSQRCREIIMSTTGGVRTRSYKLGYDPDAILSRLISVTTFGRDPEIPFPAVLRFSYTSFAFNAKLTPMNQGINPNVGLNLADVDLADMNGDSLPDLLDTGSEVHEVYINRDGRGWEYPYRLKHGFSEIKLSQTNTMVMDMNGDGASDLFQQDRSIDGYRYFPGGGTDNSWNPLQVEMKNSPGFTFGQTTKPLDLNHDGQTDVLFKPYLSESMGYVFNLDGKSFSQVFNMDAPSLSPLLNFGQEGASALKIADMNGDGLQDFVLLHQEGEIWYYPGRGVTFDPTTPWAYQGWDNTVRGNWGDMAGAEGYRMAEAPDTSDESEFFETNNFRKIRLLDINGDGMSDLVYVANNRVKAWLNKGGHAFSDTHEFIDLPGLTSETRIRSADMNGNGSVDIVWNRQTGFADIDLSSCTWVYLDMSGDVRPNLLKSIDNGIGRITEISYKSSTEYRIADRNQGVEWAYRLPTPVQVIAGMTVSDGINSYVTNYEYHDGYYDGYEKEFRGFERAEQTEIGDTSVPDLVMAYLFDVGKETEALKGKPYSLTAKNTTDEIFYNESYNWTTRVLDSSTQADDDRKVTFPFQDTKSREVLEKGKGTPVTLKWEYEFDNYGNLTKTIEHGRLDSGWDDERITTTIYSAGHTTGLQKWILDRVVEQKVTDENQVLASHQKNYYDNLPLGQVEKGNVTKIENWVSDNTYVISERKTYDSYGNVRFIYDALYGKQSGHYREIQYDNTYHTFPIKEIIYTGKSEIPELTVSAIYDYGFGKVTSSTQFNGHKTLYGYDTFGRLTSITKPPDIDHTLEYDYVLGHLLNDGKTINWVETRQKDGSADGFLKFRTFYDGLGRKVMIRSEGENPGQIVVTDTARFNARKVPWKTYLPYFDTGTLDFVSPTYQTGFTEHFYDALGREIRVNQPEDEHGNVLYSQTSLEPLKRFVQDEEQTQSGSKHSGCGMKYVEDGLQDKNGKGRLREVYETVKLTDLGENGPLTSWKTTYSYDLLDKFTGYVDSQNNRKIIQYDGLGRKTFMNDPDRGHLTYEYDDAGNLILRKDAKNQVIRYEYDGINRLIAEYDGDGPREPTIAYHYDKPSGPVSQGHLWQNSLGLSLGQVDPKILSNIILTNGVFNLEYDLNKDGILDVADVVMAAKATGSTNTTVTAMNTRGYLSWVQDESGEEHNSYDERGRVKWVVKRIKGNGAADLQNFYTAMDYDAMDRVTHLTYPDGTSITYDYNRRGLLEAVPGIIDQYDYNPSGQNGLLSLSCGVQTTYDYDHRLRLNSLKTNRVRDNLPLQDLAYTFDEVSNITAITDFRNDTQLQNIGAEMGIDNSKSRQFRATQSFIYDSLYRLTQAKNSSIYGTIDYRYDRIGNMVSKSANLVNPDPLMDLGQMTSGGVTGTWNRIGREAGGQPGPHAITATAKGPNGSMNFGYDANGNMTSMPDMIMSWDFRDRMSGMAKGNNQATYLYDYTNIRKKKVVTDTTKDTSKDVFFIDKRCEIRNGKLIKYAYAGMSRIARFTTGSNAEAFYINDHLGSTSMTLDNNGNVVEQMANYPYGRPRLEHQAESRLANYTFTGKEQDAESHLHYFEARYLVSILGTFLSLDPFYAEMEDLENDKYTNVNPLYSGLDKLAEDKFAELIENPQRINLYAYVSNNPVMFIDPNGLFKFGKRPLKGSPWLYVFSKNPLDDYFNTEISHEHGFFEDGSNENIGFGPNGRFSEENLEGYRYDDPHYDDNIMRQALKKVDDGTYSLLGWGKETKNNCQDWADRLREEYAKIEKSIQKDVSSNDSN